MDNPLSPFLQSTRSGRRAYMTRMDAVLLLLPIDTVIYLLQLEGTFAFFHISAVASCSALFGKYFNRHNVYLVIPARTWFSRFGQSLISEARVSVFAKR